MTITISRTDYIKMKALITLLTTVCVLLGGLLIAAILYIPSVGIGVISLMVVTLVLFLVGRSIIARTKKLFSKNKHT
jgi:hypothetical protein